MKNKILFLFFLLLSNAIQAQETIKFQSIENVFIYAENNASIFKISEQEIALAKYQTLLSKINIFNPRGTITAAATDNLQLPTNYIPAEIFGGIPGTFKETQFGQQYVSTVAIMPQIDLINVSSWQKIKAFKINESLSTITQLLIKKNLFETIAMHFYTIVSLQKQIEILESNYSNNKKIEEVVSNKYQLGLARQQDVNQASVNLLQIEDKKIQYENVLIQQKNELKVLCDIPLNFNLEIISFDTVDVNSSKLEISNQLLSQQSKLQKELRQQELKSLQSSFFPTLSAVGSWAYQDNNSTNFLSTNSNVFQSSYLGLRLNYMLPDTSKYLQQKSLKSSVNIAQEQEQHNRLIENNANVQLQLDYEKMRITESISDKISLLKTDTYAKNLEIYLANLISIDTLLISLNDKLTAELNTAISKINTSYMATKININNTIK
jgi:OMF family outer membrane factor